MKPVEASGTAVLPIEANTVERRVKDAVNTGRFGALFVAKSNHTDEKTK